MLANRRILAGLALALITGLGMAFIARQRDFSEVWPLVLAVMVILLVAQFGLLFGFGQTRAFRAAQRAYMRGDFDQAARLLEDERQQAQATGRPVSAQVLTLLGNTYRQQGALQASLEVLREAVQRAPQDVFPLYGLGRTQLVRGQFDEAARLIEQALAHGGRKALRADRALALYYAGADQATVYQAARRASRVLGLEDYRALLVNYILAQLDPGQTDLAHQVMDNTADGLAYWQAEMHRYQATPYGQRLAQDVAALEALLAPDARNVNNLTTNPSTE